MPDADGDSQPDGGGSSARRLAVSVEERDLSGRISQHSPVYDRYRGPRRSWIWAWCCS